MRRILFSILIFSIPLLSFSQSNIVAAEYFFDTDPGTGAATALPAFTASPNLDVTFYAASSGLSQGMHLLGIRVRDVNNLWSIPTFLPVYILANSRTIAGAEYFFDTDPGSGSATPISVTAGTTIDVTFAANSAALPVGMHVMGVRTRNALDNWSIPSFVPFYIDRSRTITKLEYYFDTDPGSGNATTIVVTPPTDLLDQIYSMNSSALALGTHTLNVRVAGQNNFWSIPETVSFTVTAPPTITSFAPPSGIIGTTVTITGTNFDTTPANNIVAFNGTAATVITSTATSITTAVPVGATTGTITVTISGSTATSATNFIVCPSAPTVTPSSACANSTVTLSASGGTSGQYRWYTVATGGTAIAGETNSSYTTLSLTATTTYHVAIDNGTCESARTSVTATITALPAAPTVTGATVCSPSTALLTASGGTTGQYRWYTVSTGGTAISGQTNNTLTTPSITATTTFYVSIDNGTCESLRTPVTATVSGVCNQPPVINTTAVTVQVEGSATISLTPLLSDPDNNLNLASLRVAVQPTSGALATIDGSQNLNLDYTGINFSGTDHLTIEVCDLSAACSQTQLSIEVVGDITVFNGLSAGITPGKNDAFHIQYIDILQATQSNKVTIFNRWGDVVFDVENYDNVNRVFHGEGNDGKELPSGIYYYKIIFGSGAESVDGFISLRR
jgi:gliding motility-associated-like protein